MLKLTEKTVADFFYVSLISQAGKRLRGLVVNSHAGDRGSIPGRNRQVVTAPMPTARQQGPRRCPLKRSRP